MRTRTATARAGRPRRGFTLIELLVVVGIIAVLIGILSPALGKARNAAMATQCKSNLHQIGLAMQMYRNDNHDYFYCYVSAGTTAVNYTGDYNNYGLWDYYPPNTTPRPANNVYSYWAIAYLPYISTPASLYTGKDGANVFKGVRSLWSCPASTWTDPTNFGTAQEWSQPNSPSSYGLSWFVWGRRAGMFRNPTQLIVCQDSPEQTIEGNGDLLTWYEVSTYPPSTSSSLNGLVWTNIHNENLYQWVGSGASYDFANALHEYYRHNNTCQCLRLDGHVDVVPYTSDRGRHIPFSWYSGQFGTATN